MSGSEAIGNLLALLVHDLRNPAATLTANVDFLKEVASDDQDVVEAIDDMRMALRDLRDGLTRMGWVADGFIGRADGSARDGDVFAAVAHAYPYATSEGSDFRARGGLSMPAVVQIFVENAERHDGRTKQPAIVVIDEGDTVCVRVDADAEALTEEVRSVMFSVEGQDQIKGRAGGRYARFVGFVAARSYVEQLGGSIRATDRDGKHAIELRVPRI